MDTPSIWTISPYVALALVLSVANSIDLVLARVRTRRNDRTAIEPIRSITATHDKAVAGAWLCTLKVENTDRRQIAISEIAVATPEGGTLSYTQVGLATYGLPIGANFPPAEQFRARRIATFHRLGPAGMTETEDDTRDLLSTTGQYQFFLFPDTHEPSSSLRTIIVDITFTFFGDQPLARSFRTSFQIAG